MHLLASGKTALPLCSRLPDVCCVQLSWCWCDLISLESGSAVLRCPHSLPAPLPVVAPRWQYLSCRLTWWILSRSAGSAGSSHGSCLRGGRRCDEFGSSFLSLLLAHVPFCMRSYWAFQRPWLCLTLPVVVQLDQVMPSGSSLRSSVKQRQASAAQEQHLRVFGLGGFTVSSLLEPSSVCDSSPF